MPEKEKNETCMCKHHMLKHGKCDALYGLGVIGAAVYFFQHATTFMLVVIGIVKAIGWPAVVVYKVLELLNL